MEHQRLETGLTAATFNLMLSEFAVDSVMDNFMKINKYRAGYRTKKREKSTTEPGH